MIYNRVSRETIKRFVDLLKKWNVAINLISHKDMDNIINRHIADSCQLLDHLPDKNITILDVGSGGGFPGVLLSFGGVKKVVLVESDKRKCAFLLQAMSLSACDFSIVDDRIENLEYLSCDVLTCRAFADLDTLFNLTTHINVQDKYLLLKGRSYNTEIKNAMKKWKFDVNVLDSITSTTGKILEIKNLSKL